jgi:hypothetical protein
MKFVLSIFLTAFLLVTGVAVYVLPDDDFILLERRARATLPGAPRVTRGGLIEFFRGMDMFYADNIPFRERLIGAVSRLFFLVGDNVNMDRCFRGKDDWLFLGNYYDHGVDKVSGVARLSEKELRKKTDKYAKAAAAFRDRGVPFYLMIGPNKSSIYPEKLPDIVRPSGRQYIRPLLDALNAAGVRTVDPTRALVQAKSDRLLYYRTDTHWNNAGSWVAARHLMAALGWPALPEPRFADAGPGRGDLLGIGSYEEFPLTSGDNFIFSWDSKPDPMPLRVWVFGDSFTDALRPYLNAAVSETHYFLHGDLKKMLASGAPPPDIALYVIVERRLN